LKNFSYKFSRTADFLIVDLEKIDRLLDSKLDTVTDKYEKANGGVSVNFFAIAPRLKRRD